MGILSKTALLTLVEEYPGAIKFVHNPDEDLILAAVRKDPTVIRHVSKISQMSLEKIVRENPFAIYNVACAASNALVIAVRLRPSIFTTMHAEKSLPFPVRMAALKEHHVFVASEDDACQKILKNLSAKKKRVLRRRLVFLFPEKAVKWNNLCTEDKILAAYFIGRKVSKATQNPVLQNGYKELIDWALSRKGFIQEAFLMGRGLSSAHRRLEFRRQIAHKMPRSFTSRYLRMFGNQNIV